MLETYLSLLFQCPLFLCHTFFPYFWLMSSHKITLAWSFRYKGLDLGTSLPRENARYRILPWRVPQGSRYSYGVNNQTGFLQHKVLERRLALVEWASFSDGDLVAGYWCQKNVTCTRATESVKISFYCTESGSFRGHKENALNSEAITKGLNQNSPQRAWKHREIHHLNSMGWAY